MILVPVCAADDLLFSDDFENRSSLGDAYATAKSKNGAWVIQEGVLVGKQTESDHGAVIRTEFPFNNVEIDFDFRIQGGKSFNFVIDDKHEKSVHAGHICRVSVLPNRITLGDDKTGSMNLEVRKQRQSNDLSAAQRKQLQERLQHTQKRVAVPDLSDTWHHLRIRLDNDVMSLFLDAQPVATLKSPGLSHPTKNKLGFTVIGESFAFDNLVIRKLSP
ncbi:family 16 glycoside hydrolase [Bremerella sp. JC770]|uniref:family 16 glycoside hydrolase n=1 Tax=Bremerella sp. JC770 TaxID=3232137 RepID=UPI003457AF48